MEEVDKVCPMIRMGVCHGVSWGGFVNTAISAMVYFVLLFWAYV